MTTRCARTVLLLAALMLGACERQPAATSFPVLPTLERPVWKVAPRKDGNVFVPAQAITERGGISGVFIVDEGRARFRMIKAGRRFDSQVEILSGLTGNEALLLGDLSAVHDGSPISRRGA